MQGDAVGALDGWSQASNKSRANVEYLAREGYWLSQSGRLDEAEVILGKALRMKADPSTAAELGFVKYRKQRADEALRLLKGAVKDAPQSVDAHYYLGTVLLQKGDKDGARAEYKTADELAGDDARPLTALCQLEALAGASAGLEAVKQKLKERFPKDAEAIITRCSIPPAD
jgi:Flp pilus assembly protein TadD